MMDKIKSQKQQHFGGEFSTVRLVRTTPSAPPQPSQRPRKLNEMATSSVKVDLFNAFWTLKEHFKEKSPKKNRFWVEALIFLDKAKELERNDPNMPLAIIVLGGVLTQAMKLVVKGESSAVHASVLIGIPRATLTHLLQALNGTDHYDQAGYDDNKNDHNCHTIWSFFACMARNEDIRLFRDDGQRRFDQQINYSQHQLQQLELHPFGPKSLNPSTPAAHLYLCFLAYLRAFAVKIDPVRYFKLQAPRTALSNYQRQLKSFETMLPGDLQHAPFPSHEDALEIAMGIEKTIKSWMNCSLKELFETSKTSTQTESLRSQLEEQRLELERITGLIFIMFIIFIIFIIFKR